MQSGDLRILRGVIHGFSEEARTRGFPSPYLGGFGFVDRATVRRLSSYVECRHYVKRAKTTIQTSTGAI